MIRRKLIQAALFCAATICGAPSISFAHHSFTAEFDVHRRVILHGTVAKFEMSNPHGWITLDVKDDDGRTTQWLVALSSPEFLLRSGWKRDSLKVGDDTTIDAVRSKDSPHTVAANVVTLPDGRKVRAGAPISPGDEAPPAGNSPTSGVQK
jgi:hypothetical protein